MDTEPAGVAEAAWERVDSALRTIARRRALLDVDEAHWLREAQRLNLHRNFGFGTLLEYMERVLGYGPHAAKERLRVAAALEELPLIGAALAAGDLSFSAVREISRVATAGTEDAWLTAVLGKSLREIEPMVAGRHPGDLPGDPPDLTRLRHGVRFDVSGATMALLRDARRVLETESGERLDDDQLLSMLCKSVLGTAGESGRPPHQIAITICDSCERAWQDGAGATMEISREAAERACCDAVSIGRVDAAAPTRTMKTVSDALRRLVWHRDHGRCVVPGCRSSRHLEIHHIEWQSRGGVHSADNCCLVCDAHHAAVHDGLLVIRGSARTGMEFTHADGRRYGAPPASAVVGEAAVDGEDEGGAVVGSAVPRSDVDDAPVRFGFRPGRLRAALAALRSHGGHEARLGQRVRRTRRGRL